MTLQIESTCSWHTHIEDQATGPVQSAGVEQFTSRGKADRLETCRQDQLGQALPNRCIVIDNDDQRLFHVTSPLS
jgi:hypothetical protein